MSTAFENYSIICHDDRAMISGKLLDANAAGCDVVSRDGSGFPVFRLRASVILNILDERKKAFINVVGRTVDVRRENDCWIYSFSWPRMPNFISRQSNSRNTDEE
ncbi:MAG: hypothetical protein A3K03_07210 [Bdellovibrionales bacterium RIFOXYD1_FULL_44_7]|nr:MAG: hypothetical protein A3K03_07210 [Bdellovibrionales bacterium RIFOXYD1_FULL_44_7]